MQGVKLELFIFDTFPLAASTALLEVARDEQFAPVKNAPGSATDSPDTARAAIMALHKRCVCEGCCAKEGQEPGAATGPVGRDGAGRVLLG